MSALPRHRCLIYQGSPSEQLPALARTLRSKLRSNHRCLYLNSPAMVAGLRSYLAAAGVDVIEEIQRGSLLLSSSQDHLADGRFDPDSMLAVLSNSVDEALRDGYDGLWATGDMAWEFGGEKNFPKLLDYECGLERLFRATPPLCGVCQYHADTLPHHALHTAIRSHAGVFVNETLSRMNPYYLAPETLEFFAPSLAPDQVEAMLRRLRGDLLNAGAAS